MALVLEPGSELNEMEEEAGRDCNFAIKSRAREHFLKLNFIKNLRPDVTPFAWLLASARNEDFTDKDSFTLVARVCFRQAAI
jgi:hypothetical protein